MHACIFIELYVHNTITLSRPNDGPTDRWTDRKTDRRTDWRSDTEIVSSLREKKCQGRRKCQNRRSCSIVEWAMGNGQAAVRLYLCVLGIHGTQTSLSKEQMSPKGLSSQKGLTTPPARQRSSFSKRKAMFSQGWLTVFFSQGDSRLYCIIVVNNVVVIDTVLLTLFFSFQRFLCFCNRRVIVG